MARALLVIRGVAVFYERGTSVLSSHSRPRTLAGQDGGVGHAHPRTGAGRLLPRLLGQNQQESELSWESGLINTPEMAWVRQQRRNLFNKFSNMRILGPAPGDYSPDFYMSTPMRYRATSLIRNGSDKTQAF